MVVEPRSRLGVDFDAYIPVLVFPHFGNSNVLYEVQEFKLEEQSHKIYLSDCLITYACAGLSCACCNNIVVPGSLCRFVQKEVLTFAHFFTVRN